MSTAWVAGTVRAKALAGRRLGAGGARALATQPTFSAALALLSRSSYGRDVRIDHTLAEAQHAVAATMLWNLRVLAGWLPRGGAEVLRLLAAGFETANVDEHLARLRGEAVDPAFTLGTLDRAWSRLAATTSAAALFDALGTSVWRVRDVHTPREVHLALRLSWAESVVVGVPEAAAWARAGAALLVVREVVLGRRQLPDAAARRASFLLGPPFLATAAALPEDLGRLARDLPAGTRWVLDDTLRPEELWRAEAAWWQRVERDGFALLRASTHDRGPVVGAAAVLATDSWRVRAALETAARGGTGAALEAFDGVA